MTILTSLRRLLGCEAHQVEDVLRSEESARKALLMSRRGLFMGAGAVAVGRVFGEVPTEPMIAGRFGEVLFASGAELSAVRTYMLDASDLDDELVVTNIECVRAVTVDGVVMSPGDRMIFVRKRVRVSERVMPALPYWKLLVIA